MVLTAVSATAQTAPQSLYGSTASQLAGFSKGSDGALTPLSGASFSDPQFQGGAMAIDGLGKFLFLIDQASSGIWMFSIQGDGTLLRAPGSPFLAPAPGNVGPAPSSPLSLAAELSGQFLYVGYQSGSTPGYGAIIEFQIDVADPANPQLIPVPAQQSSYIQASPLQMFTDPKGAHLYVALSGAQAAGTNVYVIDPVTGAFSLAGSAGGGNANERAIALDPRGQFFFEGWGSSVGFIESALVSPGGTTIPLGAPINLGSGNVPHAMLVDGSGKFLYVDVLSASGTYVYPIDSTGNLSAPPLGPLTTINFQTGTAVADPQGPYIYSLQPEGIHAFVVDATSGAVSDINGSPFPIAPGTGIGGLAISGASGQAVTGAVAQLFPPSQDFGSITVGQTSGVKGLSLTNTGGVAFNLTAVSIAGANANDFLAVPECSLPVFLPTGSGSNATCSINVSFASTAAGPRQATLTTTTDTAGTQSTILTGTGIAAPSGATLAPISLTFSTTQQGATTSGQTITLTSSGGAPLHITSVVMGGANPGDFAMVNGCSGVMAANATCNISVTFSPLGDGVRTATIKIADDAPGSPQIIPVSGTGAGAPVGRPAVTISPSALTFAAIGQGSTSPAQSITVTNSGTAALHISSIQVSGANASDFNMTNGCTAAAYAASATCTVAFTFTPSATGARTATLAIVDDAAGAMQTVALSGIGTSAPAVTISTAAVSFAGVPVGTTSPPQNITITNSGTGTLHFSSVKLSGANASDFAMSNGCTVSAYNPNQACTVGLTFTPSATGARIATLSIADDALNSPQTVAVSGNASNVLTIVAATGGSLAATVKAGQTATFNLQLISGFNGSVGFTCAGAPVSATCSVPTTIQVTSGVSVPFLVTVTTTAAGATSASSRKPGDTPFAATRFKPLLAFLFVLGASIVWMVAAKPSGSYRATHLWPDPVYSVAIAALAVFAMATLAGCGGATSVAQSAPITQVVATPPGTSIITITPTATNAGGTPLPGIPPIQLALTVN
jgi:hypothetical protein